MVQVIEGNVKPCADGDHYVPVAQLTEMPDGRLVCDACLADIRRRATEQSQISLFVSQESLFSLSK